MRRSLLLSCTPRGIPHSAAPHRSLARYSRAFSAGEPTTPAEREPPSTPGFYKRVLPEGLLDFKGREGKRMFDEALHAGHLEAYFPLSEQFITQNEPAFCGMGSLAMVLNALGVDPLRPWKGPWRWFTEETLECCTKPLEVIRTKGITLDEFQEIAMCHGASSPIFRPGAVSLEQFRLDLIESVSGVKEGASPDESEDDPAGHMVVSFWRPSLGQTGTGHFSPIAGYHAASDHALVLDVARFKYPSYWVPVEKLWEAMKFVDEDTGMSRGYTVVKEARVKEQRKVGVTDAVARASRHDEKTRDSLSAADDGAAVATSAAMSSVSALASASASAVAAGAVRAAGAHAQQAHHLASLPFGMMGGQRAYRAMNSGRDYRAVRVSASGPSLNMPATPHMKAIRTGSSGCSAGSGCGSARVQKCGFSGTCSSNSACAVKMHGVDLDCRGHVKRREFSMNSAGEFMGGLGSAEAAA